MILRVIFFSITFCFRYLQHFDFVHMMPGLVKGMLMHLFKLLGYKTTVLTLIFFRHVLETKSWLLKKRQGKVIRAKESILTRISTCNLMLSWLHVKSAQMVAYLDLQEVSFTALGYVKIQLMLTQKGFTTLVVLIFITALFLLIAYKKGFISLNTTDKPSYSQSPLPTPLTSNEVEGTIIWNEPKAIESSKAIDSFIKEYFATGSHDSNSMGTYIINGSPTLYQVGTWSSGEYKDGKLVDIQINGSFGLSANITQEIVRTTIKNKQLIVFEDRENGFLDFATHPVTNPQLIVEKRKIPDILKPDGYGTYTVNSTKIGGNLKFSSEGTFFQSSGYNLIETINGKQKLYAKDQSSQPASWDKLENIYALADVDGSYLKQSGNTFVSNSTEGIIKDAKWIKPPDLLTNITKIQAVDNLQYQQVFQFSCGTIPAEKLAKGSSLNLSDMELVMTAGTDSYYVPKNTSEIYQSIYDYLKQPEHQFNDFALDKLSYERFLNSYPVLIKKNQLGLYEVFYRYFGFLGEGGCGKPVIYLYPPAKMPISINFSSPMLLFKTSPAYQNGWQVMASPDGSLINAKDGKTYPNLYWEGVSSNTLPSMQEGFLVEKNKVESFLENKLAQYGLNNIERRDFISFWLPYFQQKPYYQIAFYTTKEVNSFIPLHIIPAPDSVLRILMSYQGLDTLKVIPPQPTPQPFKRVGFSVVEWGGIYGN